MQIKAKALQDATWKDVLSKNKTIKDNGLLKALGELKRVGDDAHEQADRLLGEVVKLIAQLKKDKAVAAIAAVVKQLGEMSAAAEAMQKDVARAQAEHEKAQRARAEVDRKAAAKKESTDGDDDEEGEASELLTTQLKALLRLVAKGESLQALVGKSGNKVAVLLSRKPISPARRKLLTEQLGGGSTKFYPGTCGLDRGATTFVLQAEVAGLSKLIKLALLDQTGLRLSNIKCRGEDGDDGDEDAGESFGAAADGSDEEASPADAADADAAAAAAREAERARRRRGRDLDDIESKLRLLRRSFR